MSIFTETVIVGTGDLQSSGALQRDWHPFGSSVWPPRTAAELGQGSTFRPWGRPRQPQEKGFPTPLPSSGKYAIIVIIQCAEKGREMANLVVRNLDQRVVDALKQRAARHGRSAEAEHRAILEEVLLVTPTKRSFTEVLASMPNVGRDEDFERIEEADEGAHVFD
jgi:antitoxin FitA